MSQFHDNKSLSGNNPAYRVTFILLLLLLSQFVLPNNIYNDINDDINGTINIKWNGRKLNIALHAQVSPEGGSIVGSVLTTDGLQAAFKLRQETSLVQIFYPYSYKDIFITQWDLIIIEGWFMMIHEFIQLIRSHSPQVVILFFCLDPTFPNLNTLLTFDVNGYMTNSKVLQKYLIETTNIPAEYILLAADPYSMILNTSIPKKYGAVYVGVWVYVCVYMCIYGFCICLHMY